MKTDAESIIPGFFSAAIIAACFAAAPLFCTADRHGHGQPYSAGIQEVSEKARKQDAVLKTVADRNGEPREAAAPLLHDSTQYATSAEAFAVPGIMQHVHFWVEIWTQLSMNQGLLHDKKYPGIIYARIDLSSYPPSRWRREIRLARNTAIHLVDNMRTQPESTWTDAQREMAAQFDLYASRVDLQGAGRRIRWQRGLRERFRAGLERSGAYLDTIHAILAEYGVPRELAYLPHVESSFKPRARSHVGALGMWQIMDYTGRRYMRIDSLVDERLDPIAATRAAARILRHNFDTLQSWPLAVTAYNHGLRGVLRAVETTDTSDLAVIMRTYKHGMFGFASRNFYSSFIAAILVAQNAEAYFDSLEWDTPRRARTITSQYSVPAGIVADYFDVPLDTLRAWNPALRAAAFAADGGLPPGYTLNLPPRVAVSIEDRLVWSVPADLRPRKENQGYRISLSSMRYDFVDGRLIASADRRNRQSLILHGNAHDPRKAAPLFAFPSPDSSQPGDAELRAPARQYGNQQALLADRDALRVIGM